MYECKRIAVDTAGGNLGNCFPAEICEGESARVAKPAYFPRAPLSGHAF